MPIFTPGRRWQPPFLPFKKEPLNRRLLASLEKAIKGRYLAAACVATVFCRRQPLSVQWSARRASEMAPAVAPRQNIAM